MSFRNTIQENSQQDLMVVVYIDRNSGKEAKIKLIFLLFLFNCINLFEWGTLDVTHSMRRNSYDESQ